MSKIYILLSVAALCVGCTRQSPDDLRKELYVVPPGEADMFWRNKEFYDEYLDIPEDIELIKKLIDEDLEKKKRIDELFVGEGIVVNPDAVYVYDEATHSVFEADRRFENKAQQIENGKNVYTLEDPRKEELIKRVTAKREDFLNRADMLQGILNEKEERAELLLNFFSEKYGMKTNRVYHFSITNMTIYDVGSAMP